MKSSFTSTRHRDISAVFLVLALAFACATFAPAKSPDPRERVWEVRELKEFFASGTRERVEAVVGAPQEQSEGMSLYRGFRVADSGENPRPGAVRIRWGQVDGEEMAVSVEVLLE